MSEEKDALDPCGGAATAARWDPSSSDSEEEDEESVLDALVQQAKEAAQWSPLPASSPENLAKIEAFRLENSEWLTSLFQGRSASDELVEALGNRTDWGANEVSKNRISRFLKLFGKVSMEAWELECDASDPFSLELSGEFEKIGLEKRLMVLAVVSACRKKTFLKHNTLQGEALKGRLVGFMSLLEEFDLLHFCKESREILICSFIWSQKLLEVDLQERVSQVFKILTCPIHEERSNLRKGLVFSSLVHHTSQISDAFLTLLGSMSPQEVTQIARFYAKYPELTASSQEIVDCFPQIAEISQQAKWIALLYVTRDAGENLDEDESEEEEEAQIREPSFQGKDWIELAKKIFDSSGSKGRSPKKKKGGGRKNKGGGSKSPRFEAAKDFLREVRSANVEALNRLWRAGFVKKSDTQGHLLKLLRKASEADPESICVFLRKQAAEPDAEAFVDLARDMVVHNKSATTVFQGLSTISKGCAKNLFETLQKVRNLHAQLKRATPLDETELLVALSRMKPNRVKRWVSVVEKIVKGDKDNSYKTLEFSRKVREIVAPPQRVGGGGK